MASLTLVLRHILVCGGSASELLNLFSDVVSDPTRARAIRLLFIATQSSDVDV